VRLDLGRSREGAARTRRFHLLPGFPERHLSPFLVLLWQHDKRAGTLKRIRLVLPHGFFRSRLRPEAGAARRPFASSARSTTSSMAFT